ncbi:MAG: CehA/McbA family metallohydrolase [Pirellulaceae bacterium]|nr:CehA/McbA family metallohydrolase [Pirellulaceae bacterium]
MTECPSFSRTLLTAVFLAVFPTVCPAQLTPRATDDAQSTDVQALGVQAERVEQTLEALGYAWPEDLRRKLQMARAAEDAAALQQLLDEQVTCTVMINPESRVKVEAGQVKPRLQQAGYVPWLVKIVNQGAVQAPLRVNSPQAGPSYSGVALLSMQRQDQLSLRENEVKGDSPRRFLHLEWFEQAPMMRVPSGAPLEYALLLVYSSEAGQREAVLEFSVGSGTQDLGFRAQLPVATLIPPALPVRLTIHDDNGQRAFARLTIRDAHGHVYPPQPRRLAPDFFFQQHIYREDGESVWLPPGKFTVQSSQGPETLPQTQELIVAMEKDNQCAVKLQRWVKSIERGWVSGDHHIHGAGCAHYTSPTEGVTPADMFRQVAGEGLNVGCVLTWGPCFEHQRHFFRPEVDALSRPRTLLKYDIEISGFGSQALGHVCLLNLRDQYYPGSEGTKVKGWPTWATPALQWAKAQGAVTGFAHSASGLQIDAQRAANRMLEQLDTDKSQLVSKSEAAKGLLPAPFADIDVDRDQGLSRVELHSAIDAAADRLPNLAIPEMNSVGAMELPVAVTVGACDFISTMDTARVAEWNMWYHVLNCGFPLKASGETDFPCMSGDSVGQGRVYVAMDQTDQIDFPRWCRGLAEGRSYVSDGYAHALSFEVHGASQQARLGETLNISQPSEITVRARIAIAPKMPQSVAYATRLPEGGRRFVGDTVTLHGSRSDAWVETGSRDLEVVVNGLPVASRKIAADGREEVYEFKLDIKQSSWVAVRAFPHLHTNPIDVLVAGQPIRASADSARWCIETIQQLWRQREKNISPAERDAAKLAFDTAIEVYRSRIQH